MVPRLVPEFDVADIGRSLAFYVDVLGFAVTFERMEERFAYLDLGGAHLMLEEAAGPGRRFRTAPLEHPFGRGMNLQIEVPAVDAVHARVHVAGFTPLIALEERWYRQGDMEGGNRQFVVADPDGYLLRLFSDLGRRPKSRTHATIQS
jgi:catechol 2,3-dioxygenase-like lactoylglutathione lyase family enzyme